MAEIKQILMQKRISTNMPASCLPLHPCPNSLSYRSQPPAASSARGSLLMLGIQELRSPSPIAAHCGDVKGCVTRTPFMFRIGTICERCERRDSRCIANSPSYRRSLNLCSVPGPFSMPAPSPSTSAAGVAPPRGATKQRPARGRG